MQTWEERVRGLLSDTKQSNLLLVAVVKGVKLHHLMTAVSGQHAAFVPGDVLPSKILEGNDMQVWMGHSKVHLNVLFDITFMMTMEIIIKGNLLLLMQVLMAQMDVEGLMPFGGLHMPHSLQPARTKRTELLTRLPVRKERCRERICLGVLLVNQFGCCSIFVYQ